MCGICGIAGPQDDAWAARMVEILEHRGPDDAGIERDRAHGVTLAMARLSILDLGGGHQPMCNEDGSIWIVFNGEIFNAPLLRPRLVAAGHRFTTDHSDTEVLLHLYEERGPAMLDELNGMFAFAIHDRSRNVLFAARDRMGIKPLYYAHDGDRLAFASELKCLLALPWVDRSIDLESIYHALSLGYVPGPESVFRGIRRIPAGHWLRWEIGRGGPRIERWWRPSFGDEDVDAATAAARIRGKLREAVERWSLSDVPYACSLSGGLDSSAIVGLLDETGCRDIKTFSLGFTDAKEENELDLARSVAERYQTDHREIILDSRRVLDDLLPMVWHLDEPYAGGLPSWYIYEAMAREVKVAITGSGGDELFGNYGKPALLAGNPIARVALKHPQGAARVSKALRPAWPAVRRLAALAPDALLSRSRREQLARLPEALSEPAGIYYVERFYTLPDAEKQRHVMAAPPGAITTSARIQRELDASGEMLGPNALAYADSATQLPEEFLLVTDRFSMAHSVEARTPFLDHELVGMVFGLSARTRFNPHDPKNLLKRAVGDLLPPEVLASRKRGFVLPLRDWTRGDLAPLLERLLDPARLAKQGLLKPDLHARYVRPHLEGRVDNTRVVWACLMLQLWWEVYVGRDDPTIRPDDLRKELAI